MQQVQILEACVLLPVFGLVGSQNCVAVKIGVLTESIAVVLGL